MAAILSLTSHLFLVWYLAFAVNAQSNYKIRLVGPSSSASRGRVEVYYDGRWGTVCGRDAVVLGEFYSQEASVVCRQLGYDGYSAYGRSGNKYGDSPHPVVLFIDCGGSEASVDQCNTYTGYTCWSGYENPWVECSGARNECYSSPCQNGGTCNDGDNLYTCSCPAGYEGVNCEIEVPPPCSSSPCQNGGTCVERDGSYSCTCVEGFEGRDCENRNECSSSPCLNGGICNDGDNSYTCTCPAGYEGDNCEIPPPCLSSPCQNGGTCVERDGSYSCTCVEGFEGRDCENRTECSSSPCLNGGTCNDGDNSYTCTCPPGYEGDNCERAPCSPSPCLNGGTCVERDGSYSCTCVEGFEGRDCDTMVVNRNSTREALRGIVTALDQLMTAIKQLMVSSSLAVQDL